MRCDLNRSMQPLASSRVVGYLEHQGLAGLPVRARAALIRPPSRIKALVTLLIGAPFAASY
jgi:hypothetical protein